MNRRVAVIDIGSNSIKALVAQPGSGEFAIETVFHDSREVRISKGISGNPPVLSNQGMDTGTEAVASLVDACRAFGELSEVEIVATSAVRSATNRQDFVDRIAGMTGFVPKILSGEEEADGIAWGVRTDPSIAGKFNKFTVFDLGGGSLELIHFNDQQVVDRLSLPLGSVRLTEQFISRPELPVPSEEADRMVNHVRESINATGFPIYPPLIGCSGGLTTWRNLRAKTMGVDLKSSPAVFSMEDVVSMENEIVNKDLQHRINTVKLPPERADIFPCALLTFKVILELAGTNEIIHSLHNLRYGLAWKALQDQAC